MQYSYTQRKGKVMEIRGLSQGLSVFYIDARIMYRTKNGYEGVETFPTFWTVGGTPEDAIKNAINILNPYHTLDSKGYIFQNYSISAVNADFDSEHRMVTHCGHRFCNTCDAPEGKHYDDAHVFNHTCIDNICSGTRY